MIVDASAVTEFLLQTALGVRVEARLFRGTNEFHAPHLRAMYIASYAVRLSRSARARL